jgi:hypothetical protein
MTGSLFSLDGRAISRLTFDTVDLSGRLLSAFENLPLDIMLEIVKQGGRHRFTLLRTISRLSKALRQTLLPHLFRAAKLAYNEPQDIDGYRDIAPHVQRLHLDVETKLGVNIDPKALNSVFKMFTSLTFLRCYTLALARMAEILSTCTEQGDDESSSRSLINPLSVVSQMVWGRESVAFKVGGDEPSTPPFSISQVIELHIGKLISPLSHFTSLTRLYADTVYFKTHAVEFFPCMLELPWLAVLQINQLIGPVVSYDRVLQERKPLLPNLKTLYCPSMLIKFLIDSPLCQVNLIGAYETSIPVSSHEWRITLPCQNTLTTLSIKYADLGAWAKDSSTPLRDIYPNLKTLILYEELDYVLRDGEHPVECYVTEWCRRAPSMGLPPIEWLEFLDITDEEVTDLPDPLICYRLAVNISVTLPSVERIGMFELTEWVKRGSSGIASLDWQRDDWLG